jgi:hypothetical protein
MLSRAVRCSDPFVSMRRNWIVRRLAPDCSRIELFDLPKRRDEYRLLYYMGWETANVHLGSPKAKSIPAHLRKLNAGWLESAAEKMVKATRKDWKEWKGA